MTLIVLSATNVIIKWIITSFIFCESILIWIFLITWLYLFIWFINHFFFSDNPDILKNTLYPTLVSLTLSISHLHVALMPLFAISASAKYKCQEGLLKPSTVGARIKLPPCTSLEFFFAIFLLMTTITVRWWDANLCLVLRHKFTQRCSTAAD